ncbi:MAG: tRNA (adenosine(37)-N6)-threonylcarbamoyltransferase complex ATPase subunit type 1 TsaE [Chloroflexota bacterium]|nr:tRNA (adenosine(37)-N6)-threonylcarbamoyltransferase complex ATPase subunit type 1 TsaE [Chloroflexota bacterium]
MKLRSSSPEHTERLGATLASVLQPGDVMPLWGGFGAGKTTLVRGVARGLGFQGPVVSPSFGLVSEYPPSTESGTALYHLDLYRVGSEQEALAFGVEDILGGDGICLIEWPGAVSELLPPDRLDLALEDAGGTNRRVLCRATGERAQVLLGAYRARLTTLDAAGD